MTTTPAEPDSDPQLAPSGDPGLPPQDPDDQPGPPIPEARPDDTVVDGEDGADPDAADPRDPAPDEARPHEAVPGTGS